MGAYTDLSAFINRATGGNSGSPEPRSWFKDARIAGAAAPATIAGRGHSLWTYDGNPAAGAAPGGAWRNPTAATNGGLKQANPGGGREKWLSYGGGGASVAGTLLVYDRLGDISGLNGTTTTAQTFTGSLTRNTGGIGNRIWIEIYSQIGTTATTATCSYTNQAGTSGQVSPAFAIGGTNNREQTRIIEVSLASGDYGVQAVANVDLLATTGTAGDFGVTVIRPLLWLPWPVLGAGGDVSALAKGIGPVEVDTDACIGLAWYANGTTAPQILDLELFMAEA